MKSKIFRSMITLGLLLTAVPSFAAKLPAENPQEKDAIAYKQAYSLVLEEKWDDALAAYDEAVRLFPNAVVPLTSRAEGLKLKAQNPKLKF